jgi:hypothetical protein
MKISSEFVASVRAATSAADLMPLLQAAIELEHATIPPYLCGYFTLKPGMNGDVADIIRSVVIEEMLHLTITGNLMLALGGKPVLNKPGFVPDYPGKLPMGIGDHLQVRLRKCSVDQVRDVYMKIEEPEQPIDIPVLAAALPEFDTIGAFYQVLSQKIEDLGQSIFVGDSGLQVVAGRWFPDPDKMFAITSVATALKGISLIIDQGEGTTTSPFDGRGEPAHYYRFQEIVVGRRLVELPGATPPFAFGGDPVVVDPAGVWDMDDDPRIDKYRPGSLSRRMAEQFSYSYTLLLNSLHQAFNGTPASLDHAIGLMYELRLLARQVLSTPAEWTDPASTSVAQTGLSFEYVPMNR